MALVSDILDDALQRLVDIAGDRWSRAELLGYLGYGLKDYARKTTCFRQIINLETGQYPARFELPKDVVRVFFVEYDDEVLDASSWRELYSEDRQFTTRTGTPTRWYMDASDITQLRLYPIPTDNDEDRGTMSGEEGTVHRLTINGLDVGTVDEFGEVVAVDDSDGSYDFIISADDDSPFSPFAEGELGGIVSVAASKVRIGYSYHPEVELSETDDVVLPDAQEEALVFFLIVRALEKSGPAQDLKRAEYFNNKYLEIAAESARRANEGFSERARSVEGSYY